VEIDYDIEQNSLRKWKENIIKKLNYRSFEDLSMTPVPKFILSAHGRESFIHGTKRLNKPQMIFEYDNEMKTIDNKFTNEVDKWIKKFLDIHDNEEFPNIIKWFMDKIFTKNKTYFERVLEYKFIKYKYIKYKVYNDLLFNKFDSRFVKELHLTNELHSLHETYIKKRLSTNDEIFDNIYLEILLMSVLITEYIESGNNYANESRDDLFGQLERMKFGMSRNKSEFIKKFKNEFNENIINIINKKKLGLRKLLRDIVLYPGQKVIMLCNAGCSLFTYSLGDTLLEINKEHNNDYNNFTFKKIIPTWYSTNIHIFCVYENRVPNISFTFAEHSDRVNRKDRGLFKCPIKVNSREKLFEWDEIKRTDSSILIPKYLKSFNKYTGLLENSSKAHQNLDQIIKDIRNNLKSKEAPFVLFAASCRSADDSIIKATNDPNLNKATNDPNLNKATNDPNLNKGIYKQIKEYISK